MFLPSGAVESTRNCHVTAVGAGRTKRPYPNAEDLSTQLLWRLSSASPRPSRAASWNTFQPWYSVSHLCLPHWVRVAICARTTSILSGPRVISSEVLLGGGRPAHNLASTSSIVITRVLPVDMSMPDSCRRFTAALRAAFAFSFFSFSTRAAISSGVSAGSSGSGFSAFALAIRSNRVDLRLCSTMSSKHSCVCCCRVFTSSMCRSRSLVSGVSYHPSLSSMSEPYTLVSLSGLKPTFDTRAAALDARSSRVRDSYISFASSFGVRSSCFTSSTSAGLFWSKYLKKLPNVAPAAAAACNGVPTLSCADPICSGDMRSMTLLPSLVTSGNDALLKFAQPIAMRWSMLHPSGETESTTKSHGAAFGFAFLAT